MKKVYDKINSILGIIVVSFLIWALLTGAYENLGNIRIHVLLIPLSVAITLLALKYLEYLELKEESEKTDLDKAIEELKGDEEALRILEKVQKESGGGEKGFIESRNKLLQLYLNKKLSKLK